MTNQGDTYYIDRVLNLDINAFAVLVERHQDMVYSIALKILGNREDAEELAQDVFVKAFQSLRTFKREAKFSTWLYRIVYNAAISKARKRHHKIMELDDHVIENYSTDEIKEDVGRLSEEDQKNMVNYLLGFLNPEDSALIALYYYNDMSIEEIGQITGLTQSNVKVRLHRLRRRLYTELHSILQKNNKEIIHDEHDG
jgi:RNA polymerase sigma-70 factor (ECF subfamily)